MRSPPPVGAWASALRVVGRAPHQPDDHHLRPWSRGARGDSERRRPDGGYGTLLPQALRSVALPGSGVPPPASTCWPNTSGICRVFITVHGFWVRSGRLNPAVAGNCHFPITLRPLTVGHPTRQGALQRLSGARKHRRLQWAGEPGDGRGRAFDDDGQTAGSHPPRSLHPWTTPGLAGMTRPRASSCPSTRTSTAPSTRTGMPTRTRWTGRTHLASCCPRAEPVSARLSRPATPPRRRPRPPHRRRTRL